MLRLKGITKNYKVAGGEIEVLKGLDISFRKNEFVSVLGPSGCGKTTTLNIVGGLDRYTSGDLVIAGKSTVHFTDKDWDVYRNRRIGFIFQSYNLIPHQTVLGNVELALTISGVPKEERVKRSLKALEKVGLKGEEYKRPNQLSGGQCQRVAIARALVNEPDILLADEPTGALDSKTSVQIMELIKEISKDRLVIMVTHNAELAEQYSTRIVRLVDGEIVEDTNPFDEEDEMKESAKMQEAEAIASEKQTGKKARKKKVKAKMSWWTAFKLSLRNLFTKRGRTVLTSFAGSIGIIGISLILAVSQGTTGYINHVQETTLSSYPLTIQEESMDLTSLMKSFMNVSSGEKTEHDRDAVYKNAIITELVNALSNTETNVNDLKSFKSYIEEQMKNQESDLYSAVSGIQYSYDLDLKIYTKNVDDEIIESDTSKLMSDMIAEYMGASFGGGVSSSGGSASLLSRLSGSGTDMWEEMLSGTDGATVSNFIKEQYDVVYGDWPNAYNEVVLVLNENNELDDLTLYALGLLGKEDIEAIMNAAINGTELPYDGKSWSYKEICDKTYKTILPADFYRKDGNIFRDLSDNETALEFLYENALGLKVTGIIRPNEDAESTMLSGSIGYTYKLTEYIISESQNSAVVKAQKSSPDVDVLTGLPFKSTTESMSDEDKKTALTSYVNGLDTASKARMYISVMSVMTEEELQAELTKALAGYYSGTTLNRELVVNELATILVSKAEGLLTEEQIKSSLSKMSDEDLLKYLTPVTAQSVKVQKAAKVAETYKDVTAEDKAAALTQKLNEEDAKRCALYYDEVMVFSESTYEDNLVKFGCLDIDSPSAINLYATTFASKDVIVQAIADYNETVDEVQQINYTDYMGLLMSSVTQIVDAVTYVLIAFVSISLIVSSIMIGVITLISVQERTKEIGILRSIGASKRDVSNLFNAETIIIGLASGLTGVLLTYLLCLPINILLFALSGIASLKATLPISAAAILVGISVLLTLLSGLIPSKNAAKKDPVVALRTE